MTNWLGLMSLLLLPAACADARPDPVTPPPLTSKLEPAPLPHGTYVRRGGTVGALELPIPPKMPLGTGAVPVSGSPARGSVVTGFREAF